jgi:two-component system, cell cycle response regulator
MDIEELLHQLDKCDCPSPSRIAMELMELLQREDASVNDAAAIVRCDPVLSAKTLKLANSILYRGLRPSVAIEDAVMRIGLQALSRLALGLSLISANADVADGFDLQRYWSAALARAIAMQAFGRQLGGWSTTELFTLGLLSDIGRLMLACAAPQETAAVIQTALTHGELLEQEREQFGFDHLRLSATLLRRWSFPDIMIAAVEPGSSASQTSGNLRLNTLCAMLDAARALSESVEGLRVEANATRLRRRCEHLGIDAETLDGIFQEIEAEWRQLAELFDIELSAEAEEKLSRLYHPGQSNGEHPLAVRVLVVDDDPSGRALLRRFLEPAGYEVLEAANADDAIAVMQHSLPRILLLDWIMPGMDGLELCRSLRKQFGARLYVLILSARIDGSHTIEALEAGANDFLVKPVARKLLLAKLQTAQHSVELMLALEEEHRLNEQTQRELTRLNDELRQAAMRDELTGLPNRRAFDNHMREAWEQARRHELPIACIMLDIDHFKQVNDEHGHDAGDRALQALAALLRTHSRAGDRAARYGGEEFVLLCLNSELDGAAQLAERLRSEAQALRGDFPQITLSAGVAQMTADMQEPAELLRAADQSLLEAKRSGRNRVIAAQPR